MTTQLRFVQLATGQYEKGYTLYGLTANGEIFVWAFDFWKKFPDNLELNDENDKRETRLPQMRYEKI